MQTLLEYFFWGESSNRFLPCDQLLPGCCQIFFWAVLMGYRHDKKGGSSAESSIYLVL